MVASIVSSGLPASLASTLVVDSRPWWQVEQIRQTGIEMAHAAVGVKHAHPLTEAAHQGLAEVICSLHGVVSSICIHHISLSQK